MRLINNWKHLASTLEVEVDVIKRLEQYGDFSPTFRLFDFLESWKPDLTIKELKETMLEIGRNDLLNLLTTEGNKKIIIVKCEAILSVSSFKGTYLRRTFGEILLLLSSSINTEFDTAWWNSLSTLCLLLRDGVVSCMTHLSTVQSTRIVDSFQLRFEGLIYWLTNAVFDYLHDTTRVFYLRRKRVSWETLHESELWDVLFVVLYHVFFHCLDVLNVFIIPLFIIFIFISCLHWLWESCWCNH